MTNVDIPSPMKKRSPQGPPPNKSKWFMTNHSEECFFFCIHKNIGAGYSKWELFHLPRPKRKISTDNPSILRVELGHQIRPPLSYLYYTEFFLAATMALPQWHRGIGCLIKMAVSKFNIFLTIKIIFCHVLV